MEERLLYELVFNNEDEDEEDEEEIEEDDGCDFEEDDF
jgi:hypothetical protein